MHRLEGDFWQNRQEYYVRLIAKTLKENPFTPINDIVYDLLLDDIVNLRLMPGKRLNERQIAEAMDVSRTPIRVALGKLEAERYVTRLPERGAFVSVYSQQDISNLLMTRRALEAFAARLVTKSITEEEYKNLLQAAEAIDDNELLSFIEFNKCEAIFHNYLISITGNRYLIDCYKQIEKRIRLLRNYICLLALQDLTSIVERKDHIKFCKILSIGDPDISEIYMKRHIKYLQNIQIKDLCNEDDGRAY